MKLMPFFAMLLSFAAPVWAHAVTLDKISCTLPADQGIGSLVGAWQKLPITLIFDSEFYTANGGADMVALKNAVTTWNQWAALRGSIAFVIANDGQGMPIPAPKITNCAQSSFTNLMKDNTVGVFKITNAGDHANARAACGFNPDGIFLKLLPAALSDRTDWRKSGNTILASTVFLNFDDFNTAGKPVLDVESLFLHSLGSVLGLLDSCNGGAGDLTSAPVCSSAPADYTSAVMAPVAAALIRRELQQNDYSRVNCLY